MLRIARLLFAFALVHTLALRADTLSLRNGTVVTGSWIGADAGQVRFLVDNQVQTYLRSDVAAVTFSEAAAATASVPAAVKVMEPELIGAVYLQDASGKLIPLMRIVGQIKTPRSTFGIQIEKPRFEFRPEPATVRFAHGQKLVFVVRLANGIDPGSFGLFRKIAKSDGNAPRPPVHFNIAKFGESSYTLTPSTDLAAGEYGFHRSDSNDVYCFGVD